MTARSGILHQEMSQGDLLGRMHGFKLTCGEFWGKKVRWAAYHAANVIGEDQLMQRIPYLDCVQSERDLTSPGKPSSHTSFRGGISRL
jgi:hypothetical protein